MIGGAARKQTDFVVRYALRSVGAILLLAVLLRTFVISSYLMSGSSMIPSILPGDFLISTKWGIAEPRRGDVVIIRCSTGRERICLKRVVAIPGDRVEFRNGALSINGQQARAKSLGSDFELESVGGVEWAIWPGPGNPSSSSEPLVIPPHFLFVLNDRRADGEDSRVWGPVPSSLIEARARLIWLSLDWVGRGGEIRPWPRVRWSRLFRGIN